ncbi:NusG domain II-containing protein [Oenococcus sp. UCMA 17063]|nr:NusG domain II-containing protein [Oenococcus sp. UCMA 17063]
MKTSAGVKKYLKMIKPLDLIIVVFLVLLSFTPLGIFSLKEQKEQSAGAQEVLTAVITHKGKVVHKIKLTGHTGTTKYRFTNGKAYNVVVATGNKVRIVEANCPDQICVHHAAINKAGQSIVCLPHKLIVEIRSSSGRSFGGIVN